MSATSGSASLQPKGHASSDRKYLYLAGVGVTHSVAFHVHNHVAKTLGLDYQFINQECPTIQDVMRIFRAPTFAGGVVTMPYKKTIMPYLDGLDELAITLGACNNVYIAQDGSLRGTNTDWRGIKGCLLGGGPARKNSVAMIIGAGGASRAAVYALYTELDCGTIYVINRDAQEVVDLFNDTQSFAKNRKQGPNLVHIRSLDQAKSLAKPYYVVGTVPDLQPQTPQELEARAILVELLSKPGERGVLLDMCFKPRRTRMLQLAERYGWSTVEGVGVIGYQVEEQWRLWAGEDAKRRVPKDKVWSILDKVAAESSAINFVSKL